MSFPPHGGPRGPPPMGFGFRGPPPGGPPPRGMMPPMSGPPPRMMNLGMRPMGPRPTFPPTQPKSKLIPQEIEDGEVTEKPPVTTVFVGSISDRSPDLMVRTLLQRCGTVVSWKRVQGADGKLQGFGFCEFERPEATLRSIRLLHEWQITDKKLVVKVDEKTRKLLDEYENAHKQNEDDKQREDRLASAALEAVMKEFANDLRRTAPSTQRQTDFRPPIAVGPKADEGLDDMPVDDDAKQLINREINRFREAYKDDEVMTELRREKDDKDGDKPGSKEEGKGEEKRERDERRRERSRSRDRRDDRRSDRDRDRERERDRRSDKPDRKERDRSDRERSDRERSERDRSDRERTDRDRDRSDRDRDRGGDRLDRERKPERSERKSRERSPRAPSRREPEEDPDERYERLRLERQLRDKEQAYQERLKNWEVRERKKIREYERERARSEERKQEEKREARRLREFLEDYDDDKDDSKYYKGNNFTRRLKEREKEAEADLRDRQKEKEEIEVLRQKLIDEGHPDPEAEINRQKNGPSTRIVTKEQTPESQSGLPPPRPTTRENSYQSEAPVYQNDSNRFAAVPSHQESALNIEYSQEIRTRNDEEPAAKKKKLTVNDVFNNEDEDAESQRKQVLMSIDEDTKKSAAEQKRLAIKRLIDRIPTDKHELFAWTVDWSMLDQTLLKTRIKPWVNKKITDYIGEEEPTLTEFICQKVMSRSQAQSILTDVAMVLDDEAEVFVVKMWRLIVYETEAKKAGLVK